MGGDVSHPVGAEHQDQWRGLGVVGEQLDEPVLLLVVVAQGEELFGLVDDEEPRLPGGSGWREGADGVPAGGDDVAVLAFAAQCGDEAGAHQGGLPGPGRAEDGEDAFGLEAFGAGADVAVAAEERFGVVDVVGHQAEVGAGVAGPLPDVFGVEGGVLAKDGLLERLQAGAGVDAELVDEAAADPGDGGQRFSLAAGTVLGEREELPPAFPQRCRLGEGLGLGENFAVVAGGDGRLEPPFLGVEAELGEAVGFEAAGLPLLELGERTAAPQGEGLGQRVRGTVGFAELEELVAAGGERLELAGVDGIDGHGEPVARAGGRDRVGAEDLAEPYDTALEVLVPGRRAVCFPRPPRRAGPR